MRDLQTRCAVGFSRLKGHVTRPISESRKPFGETSYRQGAWRFAWPVVQNARSEGQVVASGPFQLLRG